MTIREADGAEFVTQKELARNKVLACRSQAQASGRVVDVQPIAQLGGTVQAQLALPDSKENEIMICCQCGCSNTEKNPVTKEPDPYQQEINDDETEVWECASCREDSAMDI